MKGKALVMVGILVLGVAISGPMQVAAAQDYEHNWSWLAYTPEAHNWSAFEGGHEPHDWSNVLHKVVDEHDWSGVLHKQEQHNWSAFDGEHEPHDWSASEGEHEPHNWSWMQPEPGATFNPNAGWWG